MGTPGMDALIAISAGGATLLSVANLLRGNPFVYFDAATMLVTLRLLGQVVEIRMRGSAIEALRTMEALSPELARPLDGTKMVPIESLEAGQQVVIDAGGAITVDGVIEDGETLVDDALLTGEAIPHSVGPGARVQAGALNLRHRIIRPHRSDSWGPRHRSYGRSRRHRDCRARRAAHPRGFAAARARHSGTAPDAARRRNGLYGRWRFRSDYTRTVRRYRDLPLCTDDRSTAGAAPHGRSCGSTRHTRC